MTSPKLCLAFFSRASLGHPVEGIELVHFFKTRVKNAFFSPLNPGLDYLLNSPLWYPGVDLLMEAGKCVVVVGTHPQSNF